MKLLASNLSESRSISGLLLIKEKSVLRPWVPIGETYLFLYLISFFLSSLS